MSSNFMLYGSTGFVGGAIARLAVQRGLWPIIAGRNEAKVAAQAAALGLEHRVFSLDDARGMDRALADVSVVLHCAGPFMHTFEPMVEGCLRVGTHYLDLTGEIPVYAALAARDAEARAQGIMLLPGVGFDVVPTDCLALHLKQRLPSATRLALAFQSLGPAGFPPGTIATVLEMIPYDFQVRHNGQLVPFPRESKTRRIDLGHGPMPATLVPWGDAFTAFHSTGIPNIEDYMVLSEGRRSLTSLRSVVRPLFRLAAVRRFFRRMIKAGSTADERARTSTSVWGEVEDDQGRRAVSRLHGPELSVIWTSLSALAAVRRVLAGQAPAGFQTPALAYGADFVLECEGVRREDVG